MDKNQCEVFAQFAYDDSLTYEELLEAEKSFMAALERIVPEAGGLHLDFSPLGDALMCQWAFETISARTLRDLAAHIAAALPGGIRGRLLCLDKSEVRLRIFWICRGQWQEGEQTVPVHAPDSAPVHAVTPLAPDMESEPDVEPGAESDEEPAMEPAPASGPDLPDH